MNAEQWAKLNSETRARLADTSDLNPQLTPYYGDRVEVVTTYGETRRFWVGKSTGWKPIYLEVHNARAHGGTGAEREYRTVRLVRKGPRR